MSRQFEDKLAVREMTPLLVGLAGPSGCGKTYSALRIAKGIQEVTGGSIFVIDTEGRRSLHYSDDFKFRHVPFGPDFRSLDYLDAIRHCATKGARVIVVDSMSHEHEGKGGYLEFHATEENRMHGNAAAKFAAWQLPSKQRNDLIQGLLQLPISFVFCFRAKEKLRPGKEKVNGQEKSVMRELGWMPIGGQAFLYELTVCCLLPPGCNGVPSWDVDNFSAEQRLWIKKPKQFMKLFTKGLQLSEEVGRALALWSNGGKPPSENWQEEQRKAVAAATVSANSEPQPATGPDQSEPCPVCKNNPPRCKMCEIELVWRPAEYLAKFHSLRPGRWGCPRKCTPQKTTITATDWHAVLEGDKKLKDEREGVLFQSEPGASG